MDKAIEEREKKLREIFLRDAKIFFTQKFKKLDKNSNGYLDGDEIKYILDAWLDQDETRKRLNDDQVKEVLSMYDKNKDEKLDLEEFLTALSDLVVDMHRRVDFSDSYSNELDSEILVKIKKESAIVAQESKNQIIAAFKDLDTDSNGFIDKQEAKNILDGWVGYGDTAKILNDEQVNQLFKLFDKNKDNKLDLDEFIQAIEQVFTLSAIAYNTASFIKKN